VKTDSVEFGYRGRKCVKTPESSRRPFNDGRRIAQELSVGKRSGRGDVDNCRTCPPRPPCSVRALAFVIKPVDSGEMQPAVIRRMSLKR